MNYCQTKISLLVLLLMTGMLSNSPLHGQSPPDPFMFVGWPNGLNTYPLFNQGGNYAKKAKKMNKIVDEWMEGEVTFRDGKTIQCEFSYNPLVSEGLLKIVDEEKIVTGTVFSVDSFSFYDHETGTHHTYISYPVSPRQQIFAELLHEGYRHALLGRKSARFNRKFLELDKNRASLKGGYIASSPRDNIYQGTKVEKYYQHLLLDADTQKTYVLSRKELLRIMADKKTEIKAFIKANKLKFRNTEDYIAVVKEYERLTQ